MSLYIPWLWFLGFWRTRVCFVCANHETAVRSSNQIHVRGCITLSLPSLCSTDFPWLTNECSECSFSLNCAPLQAAAFGWSLLLEYLHIPAQHPCFCFTTRCIWETFPSTVAASQDKILLRWLLSFLGDQFGSCRQEADEKSWKHLPSFVPPTYIKSAWSFPRPTIALWVSCASALFTTSHETFLSTSQGSYQGLLVSVLQNVFFDVAGKNYFVLEIAIDSFTFEKLWVRSVPSYNLGPKTWKHPYASLWKHACAHPGVDPDWQSSTWSAL